MYERASALPAAVTQAPGFGPFLYSSAPRSPPVTQLLLVSLLVTFDRYVVWGTLEKEPFSTALALWSSLTVASDLLWL